MTLQEFLAENNIPYRQGGEHHHVTAGYVGVDCPRCSPGASKFKLGLREELNGASCWTCGRIGVLEALVELTGLSYPQVKEAIGERQEAVERQERRGRLRMPSGVGPLQKPHRKYLEGRGFNPDELAATWGIGGIGIAAKLSWRLFIPVEDVTGKVVSWTTRTIWPDGEPRYKGAAADEEEVDRKSILYGEAKCKHACIVCEGPSDCWRVGPGSVATMGVVVTRAQIARLSRFPVRVICLDSEPDAQRRAWDLCKQLECFPGVTFNCVLEESSDPGSATEKEVKKLRKFLE